MDGRTWAWAIAASALALAGCATAPQNMESLASLPGWAAEDHLDALRAVRAACIAHRAGMAGVCARLRDAPPRDERAARAFLEANFRPEALSGDGVLTAYFTPEYPARRAPESPFVAPVRPLSDLAAMPAHAPRDRAAIEAVPTTGALAWMRPEDLYLLQVQGSGVLELEGGARLKVRYAGSNGLPYVALAKLMQDEGLVAPGSASADAVHAWLAAHRGPEADALMRRNPRYIFFAAATGDSGAPQGSAAISLPAGRAAAVDPARHAMGDLLWIDADQPRLEGARPAYDRLVAALDTGAAIKGDIRADLYLGVGEEAGREAGLVRHRLRLYRLSPREATR